MRSYKLLDGGDHVLQHFFRHARIDTDPEGIGHHKSVFSIHRQWETFAGRAHLIECRMFHQIAGKEITGLIFLLFQIFTKLVTVKPASDFTDMRKPNQLGSEFLSVREVSGLRFPSPSRSILKLVTTGFTI